MGRRRLRDDAPRMLPHHDGARGKWYRQAWMALREELGPLSGLKRLEAARVALAWVNLREAQFTLELARRKRAASNGKHPSITSVEKLARRQGLADQSYALAMNNLRERFPRSGPASIGDLVHAATRNHTRQPNRQGTPQRGPADVLTRDETG
jgi:hypothetical protein